MTEFKTAVSDVGDGVVNLRGYSLEEVMTELDYAQGAFLAIIGRLPTATETRLVTAVLNSLLDHGFVASTITAARYIASGNPNLVAAVAGGLLAAGSNTLSPEHSFQMLDRAACLRAEGMSEQQAAKTVVGEARSAGRRVPGLGHPTHKRGDFRADVLFRLADELGLAGAAISQFRCIHAEFVAQSGKDGVPVNIDGAMASVAMDLGWSVNQTVSFALLSVLPGLMGHVIEEIDSGVPLRHITDGRYEGPELGPLPQLERN